jgi:hypothetical protein
VWEKQRERHYITAERKMPTIEVTEMKRARGSSAQRGTSRRWIQPFNYFSPCSLPPEALAGLPDATPPRRPVMASPHASESRIDGTGPRMLIIDIIRRKWAPLFDLASLSKYPAMDYSLLPPPARLPLQAILDKAPV